MVARSNPLVLFRIKDVLALGAGLSGCNIIPTRGENLKRQ
jgi:hypothetical protein